MTLARKMITAFALLCLLGAQQAAFAHWAAHLGAPAQATLEAPDQERGGTATLSQLCKSCTAFSALDAALPTAQQAPAPELLSATPGAAIARLTLRAATRHFDSRAPPHSL